MEPGGRLGYLLREVRAARSPLDRLRIVARTWKIVRRLSADERAMLAGELGVEGAGELLERLSGGEAGETVAELHGVLDGVGDTLPQRLPALIAGLRDPRKRKELLRQGLAAAVTRLAGPEPVAEAGADAREDGEALLDAAQRATGEEPDGAEIEGAPTADVGERAGGRSAARSAAGPAAAKEDPGGVDEGLTAGAGPAVPAVPAREKKLGRVAGSGAVAGDVAAGSGRAVSVDAGAAPPQLDEERPGPPTASAAPAYPSPPQLSAGWERLAAPPGTTGHPTQPVSSPLSTATAGPEPGTSGYPIQGSSATAAGRTPGRSVTMASTWTPPPADPVVAGVARDWASPPGAPQSDPGTRGPSLIARFRRLREALGQPSDATARARGATGGAELGELLDGFPEGWARRRALGEALRSGLPASLDEAASRVTALTRPIDRLWCWSALIEGRDLERGEALALLAAETSPAIRRRLERRLEPRTG